MIDVACMKLVTYRAKSTSGNAQGASPARGGILVGETVLDLEGSFAFVTADGDPAKALTSEALQARFGVGVLGFVEHESEARPTADIAAKHHLAGTLPSTFGRWPLVLPLASVDLLAPIPRPPSMRDGYAFRQHVETARKNRGLEMIPEFDQFPVFYFTNHQSVIGPGELRVQKLQADRLDFELEAAIVVGRGGKNLRAKDADRSIFGLTIMNDFSARALQMEEMKLSLGPAKGKDFATGLGPWLVTLDELQPHVKSSENGARFDLGMRAFVNGVQVSNGNVKDMNWTFAQILERASYGVNLYPGDVIGSGTCGTGCFLELNGSKITNNQWLRHGDTVALEIDGLGRLEHQVFVDDSY
jgi:fumarylacetoacetate (FAA) hydrolase